MKIFKKIIVISLIVIIVLPVLSYVGIVITNNCIADQTEKDLVSYQLPANTELVDSISIAGKLTGNGNGMQYVGAILVDSNLSEEELEEYYSSEFDYIEVRKQENAVLDFTHLDCSFDNFPETSEGTYYSVICWDSNRREIFGDFICGLLDIDIRGH